MKKTVLISFLSFIALTYSYGQSERKRCGFAEVYQELQKDSTFLQTQAFLEKKQPINQLKSQTVFIVPVVIHAIHRNSADSISDAQILSQIDVLNTDYRKLNADTTNVESGFSVADVRIEFCLAQRDPNGNNTSGIVRYKTNIDDICNGNQYLQVAPIWNRDHYLNIWVCDLGTVNAGYAYSPGAAADRDGVVIHYSNFGDTGTLQANYDHGRTATHEVGHWFNLKHPWGNDNPVSCATDDGVSDTPNQGVIYENCPPPPQNSCGSKDMLSNFMGYVYDDCMGNFTEGQKNRMRTALVNSRTTLLLSNGCLPVGLEEKQVLNSAKLYPNPSKGQFILELSDRQLLGKLEFKVYNLQGKSIHFQTNSVQKGYSFEVADVEAGIYFLSIQSAKAKVLKKIIIQP
jgi:hypothetical protein